MIRLLVKNGSAVLLLVLATLVFGIQSYNKLPRESFPDVKIPVVLVSTPYIGVSPEDVETLITIPIERELAGLKDVKKMSSTSAEGASIISLEFEPEVVIEDALQRVRDRVNRVKPDLPADAEDPAIREISFSDVPIMIVTLAGSVDEEQLKKLGEDLEDAIGRVDGVLDTRLSGGRTRELQVQVDPVRLANYGLSFNDVINAIGNENVNIPGGDVTSGAGNFLLRVPGELESAQDIESVAIKRTGDRPVFIRDVATVVDSFADRTTYARMNGEPAVSVGVTKRTGANIISIADGVKEIVAEQSQSWPAGVEYRILADQSEQIGNMVGELENNIVTSLLLVVAVIVFFMGVRNSLFVAFAIPMSMLASFAVLEATGITLNMVVLFSLILALGMLVDNGIVIIENIYRHMELGKDLRKAAIDGTSEVALAVAASTATTIAAFAPLAFWTGIMGQFMGFLPKTVIVVLTASLVVAVGILPVGAARFLKRTPPRADGTTGLDEEGVPDNAVMRGYRSILEWSIDHRYISAFAGFASLVLTVVAYAGLNHGTEFFPEVDPNRVTVTVQAADGTDLETTDQILRRIEGMLANEPNVDVFVAESGVPATSGRFGGAQSTPNEGKITVDFLPTVNNAREGEATRVESTTVTVERIRAAATLIPGAEIAVDKERMGPPVGAAIAVEVSGDDFHEVGELAAKTRRELATIPGVTDLSDDYRVGRPEMRLRIDRGAAKRIGASTREIANVVRTAVAGAKASALRDGSDEYDVVVQLDPRYRGDLQRVLDLRVAGRQDKSPDTYAVPLSTVASYELAGGSGSIRHVDQKLVVTIGGDVAEGFNDNEVREAVSSRLGEIEVGRDQALRLGGADDEQRNAQEFLQRAMLIALSLIAIVLVTQFNGFSNPLIIMASVILSLVGVLWGLILTGTPFGIIMTGIGVISLAGVVVNNAIVLLDYVEQLRRGGMAVRDALVRAGMTRLRPVMLTAITTVLGLVPMALGITIDFRRFRILFGGESAGFWGAMAVAVIFGLSFATVLTLVLVPTLYSITDDFGSLYARIFKRRKRVTTAVVTGTIALLLGAGLALWGPRAAAAPVTLEQAFTAAQQHNLDLAIASERTSQTETLRGQAWALVSPRVTTQGSYTYNDKEIALDFADTVPPEFQDFLGDSEPIIVQEQEYLAGNVSVIQPLFTGQALPLLRGAYQTVDAARLDEAASVQRIRAGVARAYYGLAVARQSEALARTAADSARAHLELADRQVAAGMAPERARLQAQLALAQAERQVATAHEQVVAATEAFSRATGLPRDSEVVMPEAPAAPANLEQAMSVARERRPDVAASEKRVEVARLSKTAKALGWLPELNGRFTYSYTENAGFSGENTMWMVVLTADWTLWDGGLRLAQTREEASKVRMAGLVAEQQRQVAEEQVRTAWERLNRAESALDSVQREVSLAEQNLELAKRSFEAGSVTWLEVEDARLGLVQAQLGALNERSSRDLAAVDLLVSMGQY